MPLIYRIGPQNITMQLYRNFKFCRNSYLHLSHPNYWVNWRRAILRVLNLAIIHIAEVSIPNRQYACPVKLFNKILKIVDWIDKFERNCQFFINFRPIGDINWWILDCKTSGNYILEKKKKIKKKLKFSIFQLRKNSKNLSFCVKNFEFSQ